MNIKTIKVPFGIQFISQWKDYNYPKGHCIVDKGVTGCGYTEYCLRNNENIILCSPRKLLLENKEEQHKNDSNILYLKNEIGNFDDVKDIETKISNHIYNCTKNKLSVKFMVTYDSAHYIIDYLEKNNFLDKFNIVADEFQSIFLDSYFKASVENDFVDSIQKCKNIIYLSATPMLEKYLNMLDYFKDLDYYTIDWSESGYVEAIQIQRKHTNSLGGEVNKIIQDYLSGKFPFIVKQDNTVVQSKEAVFYFNEVGEIVKAIKKNGLDQSQVNVLCAATEKNKRKLRKVKVGFGKIPLQGESRKMFTFCTSTCYIGADFYSDNASTYIFADPNLRCLAMDISLDLPQIAGRQRDRNNPFKNNITIFYKTLRDENLEDRCAFDKLQDERKRESQVVLDIYDKCSSDAEKLSYVTSINARIYQYQYEKDFISISKASNLPTYNNLIEVANERAWEVSQKDYQDSINVTRALEALNIVNITKEYRDRDDQVIDDFLKNKFYSTGIFSIKLEEFCNFMDQYKNNLYIISILNYKISDFRFRNFYYFFGTEKCKALKFREGLLTEELLNKLKQNNTLDNQVFKVFPVGNKYTLKYIKEQLELIYTDFKLAKTPKASDLEQWFEIKSIQWRENGKKINGFEIVKKK